MFFVTEAVRQALKPSGGGVATRGDVNDLRATVSFMMKFMASVVSTRAPLADSIRLPILSRSVGTQGTR